MVGHICIHSFYILHVTFTCMYVHSLIIACFDSSDVSNSEFVCGKAEDVMPELQKDMKFWEEAVSVVDPPRAGLRK